MKIQELTEQWERSAKGRVTKETYQVNLPVEDAARLAALHEMYPKRRVEDLITDLLSTALEELEERLPYQAGTEVIAYDEMGDPLYSDVGPTPRFLELSKKYLQVMSDQQGQPQH